ncbi:YczE/YyaS/YitT family protein [Micropruina sp.]|uniref:membrane protein YczE n=1 Tax=Micropruina sp. TaxID=2737536 RepID=UPI0039E5497E
MSTSRPIEISNLGPLGQLRTGRLPRRVVQLFVGLVLFGFSIALMLRGNLGVAPWDVLSIGLTHWLPLSFGQITIALSFVVLLLWIPVGERPGVGTLANAIVIGLAVDASLAWLPVVDDWAPRIALMLAGVVLNGIAGAVYIGAQLGRGPRDGLMTGLARRTGRSLRLVRSLIEVVVLLIGLALGGTAGLGTLVFALAIGPLTQFFLAWTLVARREPAVPEAA